MHAHLIHKEMWSEKLWNSYISGFSKTMKVPKKVIEKFLPMLWGCNAKVYVEQMEEAGIDKALVMGADWGLHPDIGEAKWSIEEANEWIANQANEYPDKLFSLCALDPRREERAVQLLEKAVGKWGMKGLKLHPTSGYYPDDPTFFPLYEKCLELDVPVHSHTAATIMAPLMSKYADPIYLDTLAAKFPDLKIVMIHCGSMSYPLKCLEIMSSRPNVYAELSGYQAQARYMPAIFLQNLRAFFDMPALLGPPPGDKIMYGTDWPLLDVVLSQKKWIEWLQAIPEKGKEYGLKFKPRKIKKLLGLNAKKFLRLR